MSSRILEFDYRDPLWSNWNSFPELWSCWNLENSRDFERNIQLGTCTHRICPSYSIYSLEIIIKIRVMKPMKFNNSLIKSMISKFCALINNLIFQMISQKFNLRKRQRCKICKILAMKPTPDISWKVNITDYLSASISDLVRIISAVKMIFYPLPMDHWICHILLCLVLKTALFDKCEKLPEISGDFILIFDKIEIDSRSIKFQWKFQIDRIIIFGTCNFEVYTFSNSSFIILLSKTSSTGFLIFEIFEIDEKIEFIFFW